MGASLTNDWTRHPHSVLRCVWVVIACLVAAWQVAIFAIAIRPRVEPNPPLLSPEDREFVASLSDPSPSQVAEARESLGAFREYFEASRRYSCDLFDRWFAGESHTSLSTVVRSFEIGHTCLGAPPMIPIHDSREQGAWDAVKAGCFPEDVIDRLGVLRGLRHPYVGWGSELDLAEVLAAVIQGDSVRARNLLESHSRPHRGRQQLLSVINSTSQGAPDFQSSFETANAFSNHLGFQKEFSKPLSILFLRALDFADTDAQKAMIAQQLAALTKCRELNLAAARLATGTAPSTFAEALASLGHWAHEKDGHRHLARELFHMAAKADSSAPSFGRSAFNYGLLLREANCPAAAIDALRSILPSNANDFEAGTNLMEAYRNYRHRAALEIARAYNDLFNYPAAYLWRRAAETEHRYKSWCGTCRWAAAARGRNELAVASFKAGPIFVVWNLVSRPVQNWTYWGLLFVTIVSYRVGRRIVRRFRRRNEQLGPS